MSVVVHHLCDGPDCLRSDEDSLEEFSLLEAGWLVVNFVDDEEARVSHFCSYRCLGKWAMEAAE